MIEFKNILRMIENQFNEIIHGGDCVYKGFHVSVAEEQDFNRIKCQDDTNHIYIVVKFLAADINYGQVLLPITITAVSEDRKLDVCKRLLFEFADRNNMKIDENSTIKQFYTSPQVMSNFEEIYDGYRSLLYLSGVFTINENANPYEFYYVFSEISEDSKYNDISDVVYQEDILFDKLTSLNIPLVGIHIFRNIESNKWNYAYKKDHSSQEEYLQTRINLKSYGLSYVGEAGGYNTIIINVKKEHIENLNNQFDFTIQHDSQLFFNSNNNVISTPKSKVRVISISTFLLDTKFINKAISISLDLLDEKTTFLISKEYKNGLKNSYNYKLAGYSEKGAIGEFPLVSISLTM